jgi:hypothetical protein
MLELDLVPSIGETVSAGLILSLYGHSSKIVTASGMLTIEELAKLVCSAGFRSMPSTSYV